MNDWIEWKGGECPVAGDARVELKLRDGRVSSGLQGKECRWAHAKPTNDYVEWNDIIAYRLSLPSEIAATKCDTCGNTGDVHRADGEYLGPCPWCAPASPAATPRTDAEAFEARKDTSDKWQTSSCDAEVVDADFARTLEREAAELRAQLAEAQQNVTFWKANAIAGNTKLAEAERQRDEALKDAERWREHLKIQAAGWIKGALHIRMTMVEADDGNSWAYEYVLAPHELLEKPNVLNRVAMAAQLIAHQMFAAIDAAKESKNG